jgi:hypothetical protein
MTFAVAAAEIDALAKKAKEPFDYYLSSLFRKEADAQGVSSEKAEAFRIIGCALEFPFHADDPVHPFGDPRTNRSLEYLTLEQTAELESIAPQIQTAQIRARLADVAWMRKRKNPASARLAVAAYVASARALEDPQQWTECANRVERAGAASGEESKAAPIKRNGGRSKVGNNVNDLHVPAGSRNPGIATSAQGPAAGSR